MCVCGGGGGGGGQETVEKQSYQVPILFLVSVYVGTTVSGHRLPAYNGGGLLLGVGTN